MPKIKDYFFNTLWMMSRPVLRLAAAFFVGIFVVRYLGPARFGQLSFAESFSGLFFPLAVLGMDTILMRDLVKDASKSNTMLGTAFVMKIIGSGLMIASVSLAVQFTSGDIVTKIMTIIIASSVIFCPLFHVTEQHFQSQVKAKFSSLCENLSVFFSTGLKVVFLCLSLSVVWFAIVILLERMFRAIVLLFVYAKQGGKVAFWKFDTKYARSLIRDSWPMFFSGFSVVLYMKIDQVMIKEMISNEALGNYAAAVRVSEMWYFIPIIICTSLFPAILTAQRTNYQTFLKRMHNLYAFLFWLAICIAVPMTFLSTIIVTALFGDEYVRAGTVLSIHIWAAVFFFLQTASGRWLIAQGQTRKILYMNLGGLSINLFLNFFLIPRIGIIGAAVATLLAQMYSGFFYDAIDKDMRTSFIMKLKVWTPFWRIF